MCLVDVFKQEKMLWFTLLSLLYGYHCQMMDKFMILIVMMVSRLYIYLQTQVVCIIIYSFLNVRKKRTNKSLL